MSSDFGLSMVGEWLLRLIREGRKRETRTRQSASLQGDARGKVRWKDDLRVVRVWSLDGRVFAAERRLRIARS